MTNSSKITEQIAILQSAFPKLCVLKETGDDITLIGEVEMFRQYNDVPLFETYDILINVPVSFPDRLPQVFERSRKIPRNFSHQNAGGEFCLGVTTEIFERLIVNPTLIFFFEEFVLSYLYSASYFAKYHAYPFDDRSHGDGGILEFYSEKFGVNNTFSIVRLLDYILAGKYRGHLSCPCGSGKHVRSCHGKQLLSMFESPLRKLYLSDLNILRRMK